MIYDLPGHILKLGQGASIGHFSLSVGVLVGGLWKQVWKHFYRNLLCTGACSSSQNPV